MKILCHVGPWCVSQYKAIANSVNSDAEVTLISGFKDLDETGFQASYYRHVNNKSAKMSGLDEDDFIFRCRLLRSLSRDEARLHLFSTRDAIAETLDELQPDLVISEVVDQFLIDVLRHECDKRSIPFYGLVVSFVNGYFRVTGRGERNVIREGIEKSEVDNVVDELARVDYTPTFIKKGGEGKGRWKNALTRLYKSNLKIPYFFIKRHISGEKYNYHYWASYVSAVKNFHIIPRYDIGEKLSSIDDNSRSRRRIYIPLQMYPEATIEYWCDDLNVIDYDRVLIKLVERLVCEFDVIVKEHPNVIGLRNPKLYDELNNIDGVFLCETYAKSNDLVEMSDAVLVWTGSVGFEAALRGKAILTVSEPYYMSGNSFKKIDVNTGLEEIASFVDGIKGSAVTSEGMVNQLLQGLAVGRYKNDDSWSPNNTIDQADANCIGKVISKLFYSKLPENKLIT